MGILHHDIQRKRDDDLIVAGDRADRCGLPAHVRKKLNHVTALDNDNLG